MNVLEDYAMEAAFYLASIDLGIITIILYRKIMRLGDAIKPHRNNRDNNDGDRDGP